MYLCTCVVSEEPLENLQIETILQEKVIVDKKDR